VAPGGVYLQSDVCLLSKTDDHVRRLKMLEHDDDGIALMNSWNMGDSSRTPRGLPSPGVGSPGLELLPFGKRGAPIRRIPPALPYTAGGPEDERQHHTTHDESA
jgi:hypothetical protein